MSVTGSDQSACWKEILFENFSQLNPSPEECKLIFVEHLNRECAVENALSLFNISEYENIDQNVFMALGLYFEGIDRNQCILRCLDICCRCKNRRPTSAFIVADGLSLSPCCFTCRKKPPVTSFEAQFVYYIVDVDMVKSSQCRENYLKYALKIHEENVLVSKRHGLPLEGIYEGSRSCLHLSVRMKFREGKIIIKMLMLKERF